MPEAAAHLELMFGGREIGHVREAVGLDTADDALPHFRLRRVRAVVNRMHKDRGPGFPNLIEHLANRPGRAINLQRRPADAILLRRRRPLATILVDEFPVREHPRAQVAFDRLDERVVGVELPQNRLVGKGRGFGGVSHSALVWGTTGEDATRQRAITLYRKLSASTHRVTVDPLRWPPSCSSTRTRVGLNPMTMP